MHPPVAALPPSDVAPPSVTEPPSDVAPPDVVAPPTFAVTFTMPAMEALLREPEARLRAEARDGGADIESARFLFALEREDRAA